MRLHNNLSRRKQIKKRNYGNECFYRNEVHQQRKWEQSKTKTRCSLNYSGEEYNAENDNPIGSGHISKQQILPKIVRNWIHHSEYTYLFIPRSLLIFHLIINKIKTFNLYKWIVNYFFNRIRCYRSEKLFHTIWMNPNQSKNGKIGLFSDKISNCHVFQGKHENNFTVYSHSSVYRHRYLVFETWKDRAVRC